MEELENASYSGEKIVMKLEMYHGQLEMHQEKMNETINEFLATSRLTEEGLNEVKELQEKMNDKIDYAH